MPALFVFLLKVNIALVLFCAGYYLVLRHLTFYTLNRVYLMAAILFASLYPTINLDNFALRHQQIARPAQLVVANIERPELIKPLSQPGYWLWIEAAFWLGATVLALKLLIQLYSLYKLHRLSVPMKIRDHTVRVIHGDANPFSFWRSIYVNPANHSANDLNAILKHEQIHVNEWHTLDVMLAEISTIFYWFNPGIWLMKRAVKENIEFITDRKIVNNGIDSKTYQYSLVNVSFATTSQGIVNHFSISTIKKRIIMMNAKRSSRATLTRYLLLIPLVVLCLLIFSFSKAELVKETKKTYKNISLSVAKLADISPAKTIEKLTPNFLKDTTRKTVKRVVIDTITISRKGHKDSVEIVKHDVATSADWAGFVPVSGKYSFNLKKDTDKNWRMNFRLNLSNKISEEPATIVVMPPNGGEPNMIKKVRINGRNFMSPGIVNTADGRVIILDTARENGKIKTLNGHPILDTVFVTQRQMVSNSLKELLAVGHPLNDSTKLSLLKKMQGFNVNRDGKVVRDSVMIASGRPIFRTGKPANVLNIITDIHDVSIDNLADKLIIIDGKEVSIKEYRRMSAGDIVRIRVNKGDNVIKEYGEKAKNGVLIITTKKEK